ncbi:MAG TPA: hypothetical protein VHN39_12350 [Phenylobacterium sp.]|nr:hypothetical protein [Phenylobacterium sp.]
MTFLNARREKKPHPLTQRAHAAASPSHPGFIDDPINAPLPAAGSPPEMPMYLFYPCRDDGLPTSLEAFELADDAAARDQACSVLAGHASATQVTVWCDGEALETVCRGPPHPGGPPQSLLLDDLG